MLKLPFSTWKFSVPAKNYFLEVWDLKHFDDDAMVEQKEFQGWRKCSGLECWFWIQSFSFLHRGSCNPRSSRHHPLPWHYMNILRMLSVCSPDVICTFSGCHLDVSPDIILALSGSHSDIASTSKATRLNFESLLKSENLVRIQC